MHPRVLVSRRAEAVGRVTTALRKTAKRGGLDTLLDDLAAHERVRDPQLRDLFQLETLAAAVERLLATLDRQAKEIAQLRAQLKELQPELPEEPAA